MTAKNELNMLQHMGFKLVLTAIAVHVFAGYCEALYAHVPLVHVPDVENVPAYPHLWIDSPRVRGVVSFKNGKLLTGGHLKMNGMFDPTTKNLDFNFSCPGFHLIGDYTANLEVLDPNGPGTVLHGDGHVDLTYNGYGLREATYKAFFHPGLRKYQTEYPSYDLKLDSVVGEVTGLRRVADNSTIDLDQALKLFHSLEQPMLVEFYRSLGNHHVQRRYARNLGDGLLYSFFNV